MGVALMPFYGQADTHNATWYPMMAPTCVRMGRPNEGRKISSMSSSGTVVSNDMPRRTTLYLIHKAGWSAFTGALDGTSCAISDVPPFGDTSFFLNESLIPEGTRKGMWRSAPFTYHCQMLLLIGYYEK